MESVKSGLIERIVKLINNPITHSAKFQNPGAWDNLELTKEQLRLLAFMFMNEKSSPSAIAAHFGVSKANVTSVIHKLVEKGLLDRKENPKDRRAHIITITENGSKQIRKLREMHAAQMVSILKLMKEDDLKAFAQGLEAFAKIIKEGSNECT